MQLSFTLNIFSLVFLLLGKIVLQVSLLQSIFKTMAPEFVLYKYAMTSKG